MDIQDVQKMIDVVVNHEFEVAVKLFTTMPSSTAYDRLTNAMRARQYWFMLSDRERDLKVQHLAPLSIGQWIPKLLNFAEEA